MKVVDREAPVQAEWLAEQGYRLDAAPYLSGAFEARKLLERLSVRKEALSDLTSGHAGGIYNGPQFRRIYLDNSEYAVPFLGSTDMLEADFTYLPLLRNSDALRYPYLRITEGTALVSCSGTVGRMTYARPDMEGFWSSQHVMKVVPDSKKIRSGYLYAYLSSRFGVPMVVSSAYGAIVQHIEPGHILDLPVPRFDAELERRIHELVQQAAELRARYQRGIVAATEDLFTSARLPELAHLRWHEQPRDLGFDVHGVGPSTLRALNYAPRAQRIAGALRSVPHRTLGDICAGGRLSRGNRFKRIDTVPGHGICLVGQRQGFWLRPEGRWISPPPREKDEVRAREESVLVASRGTLGENEVYCRAILVGGRWLDYGFSEDFLRVVSGDDRFPGAYIFAFLRSHAAFRLLRSMSVGGKQQDLHPTLRARLPVPECTAPDRARIAETVRQAHRDRDNADATEDSALALLDTAVRDAAR